MYLFSMRSSLLFILALAGSGHAADQVKRRIMVIPFDNMLANKNHDWMSEAISDNLRAEILKSGRFEVMDAMLLRKINPKIQFAKLSDTEATKLAAKMNCEAVIIGRYFIKKKEGKETALIQAEGVDAISGKSVLLKSQNADMDAAIFAKVQDLAQTIADEFNDKLAAVGLNSVKRDAKLEQLIVRLETRGNKSEPVGRAAHRAIVLRAGPEVYAHLSAGYFLPLGFAQNQLSGGFFARGAGAIELTRFFVPYVSGGAMVYTGKNATASGFFYFANAGLAQPLQLTRSINLMPYVAAGALGGSLKSSVSSVDILVPAIDAGVFLTWHFTQQVGATLSASAFYAMDRPNALLFTIISTGISLRF